MFPEKGEVTEEECAQGHVTADGGGMVAVRSPGASQAV